MRYKIILFHLQIATIILQSTMPKNKKDKKEEERRIPQVLSFCESVQIKVPSYLKNQNDNLQLLQHYLKGKIMKRGRVSKKQPIIALYLGKQQTFFVERLTKIKSQKQQQHIEDDIGEGQVLQVTKQTQVILKFDQQTSSEGIQVQEIQLYGNCPQYQQLKETVVKNLLIRDSLISTKLGAIKGIILGGPTGTGKTTYVNKLARDIAKSHKIHFKTISSTQLLSKVVGGAQEFVRNTFKNLFTHPISCLIIEDMHLLFGEKEISAHETTLSTLFSEMQKNKPMMVIGTFNSERDLSRSIYQSGKFQKEISLNMPNHYQRLQILCKMIQNMKLIKEIDLQDIKQINLRLNGFSIGQIKQFLRDAFISHEHNITKQNLQLILKKYRPADIKSLIVEVPQVKWDDIGGYEEVKKNIKKVTQLPLKYPKKFKDLGISPSKGVLLYGPPGCSKTMMAKAIATQSKLNFIGIKGPQLFSKYVGDSQKAIRNIFKKARAFSPCIIFFDQIDALASQRSVKTDVTDRVLCQLLSEMDGIQGLKEVVIIAATNRPQILDQALTRPGRFDSLIYVSPPDRQAREKIFEICLKKTPLQQNLQEVSKNFAQKTQNYTGAQISLICRQAALTALDEDIEATLVKGGHLQKALKKIPNRLSKDLVKKYEQFSNRDNKVAFGSVKSPFL